MPTGTYDRKTSQWKPWNKGIYGIVKTSPETETRKRMSEAQKLRFQLSPRFGSNAAHWKGGITNPNRIARTSKAFREWSQKVFARDNWTCQKCHARGIHLHPHHIREFAKYPELRFDVDNGLTMCRSCHMEHHGLTKRAA